MTNSFSADKNYYEILEVDQGASLETIKKAYRKLARKWHPDTNKEPGAEDRFKLINEAHEVLTDEVQRADYDKFLELLHQPSILAFSRLDLHLGFMTRHLLSEDRDHPPQFEIVVDVNETALGGEVLNFELPVWRSGLDPHPWAMMEVHPSVDYDETSGENFFPFVLVVTINPWEGELGLNQDEIVMVANNEEYVVPVSWKLPGAADDRPLMPVSVEQVWQQYIRLGRSLDLSFKNMAGALFPEERGLPAQFIKVIAALRDNLKSIRDKMFPKKDGDKDEEVSNDEKIRAKYGDPKRFSLAHVMMVGSDFSGASMRRQDIEQAKLMLAKLVRTDLSESNLRKANLTFVQGEGAIFVKAILTGAKLGQAHFVGADFSRASLMHADLSQVHLHQAVMEKAKLNGSKWHSVLADGINLIEADLSKGSLQEVSMVEANLTHANCTDANFNGVDFTRALLEGVTFSGENMVLSNVSFNEALAPGINLEGLTLNGCSFRGTQMPKANLKGCDLRGFDLSGADLREADLSDTDLTGANLAGANLTEANLKGTVLAHARLNGADLSNVILDGETNFQGADLRSAVLVNLNLVGADMQDTQLQGAIFLGSDVWGVFLFGARYDDTTVWPEGLDQQFIAAENVSGTL